MNQTFQTPALPSTMRAMVIDHTGEADVFREDGEFPAPPRVSDEFLIRVHAAAVNPIDSKTRAGGGVSGAIPTFPWVLGNDFSGTVVASPYEHHPIKPGDEVYGMARVPRGYGTYAEYASIQMMSVSRKPTSLDHTQAAGVPLAALTAWGAVMDVGGARAGQRILIHAGAGGVGHFAVQFAAHAGAHVITTGSTRNQEFLAGLGAHEVIDYTTERFEEVIEPVDTVIDLIGNVADDTGTRSLKAMKPGGLLVNVPSFSWPNFLADAAAAGMRATSYKVAPDARVLDAITALIDQGTIRVHIDRVLPLAEVAEAHRLLEHGHTRGKIVLAVS